MIFEIRNNLFNVSSSHFQRDKIVENVATFTLCFVIWARMFKENSRSWALVHDKDIGTCTIGRAWHYDRPSPAGQEVIEAFVHTGRIVPCILDLNLPQISIVYIYFLNRSYWWPNCGRCLWGLQIILEIVPLRREYFSWPFAAKLQLSTPHPKLDSPFARDLFAWSGYHRAIQCITEQLGVIRRNTVP